MEAEGRQALRRQLTAEQCPARGSPRSPAGSRLAGWRWGGAALPGDCSHPCQGMGPLWGLSGPGAPGEAGGVALKAVFI